MYIDHQNGSYTVQGKAQFLGELSLRIHSMDYNTNIGQIYKINSNESVNFKNKMNLGVS